MKRSSPRRLPICADCGADTSARQGNAQRCITCASSRKPRGSRACIDCGTNITGYPRQSRRCKDCQVNELEQRRLRINSRQRKLNAIAKALQPPRLCVNCKVDISDRGSKSTKCITCMATPRTRTCPDCDRHIETSRGRNSKWCLRCSATRSKNRQVEAKLLVNRRLKAMRDVDRAAFLKGSYCNTCGESLMGERRRDVKTCRTCRNLRRTLVHDRTCQDCGSSITHRGRVAIRCIECARTRDALIVQSQKKERICMSCRCDISHRHFTARYCLECRAKRKLDSQVEGQRKERRRTTLARKRVGLIPLGSRDRPTGTLRHNTTGYVQIKLDNGLWAVHHRYVMEQHIGRPLLKIETVHHLNGDRKDNRLENLELWSRSQPAGQRVADKLKWAREILATYKGQLHLFE